MTHRYISRVVIDNYQSHAHSEFEFGPGLNVLTGPSDNGKSAVLRAIRWALYNEPRGSDFVRFGQRECRVALTMSDEAEIVRELLLSKSGTVARSRYLVTLPGREQQVFEGFGVDPPAEVGQAHGMAPVKLDMDKETVLNFGSQLEGPFLLADTGSVRARAIGRLLGVHVVDAAVRDTQKDQRDARAHVTKLTGDIAKLDEQLAPYTNLPEQEAQLAEAQRLLDRVKAAEELVGHLQTIQVDMEACDQALVAINEQLSQLEITSKTVLLISTIGDQVDRLRQLDELRAAIDQADSESVAAQKWIQALAPGVQAEKRVAEIECVVRRLTELVELQTERRQLAGSATWLVGELDSLACVPEWDSAMPAVQEWIDRLSVLEPLQAAYSEAAAALEVLKQHLVQFANLPAANQAIQLADADNTRLSALVPLAADHTRIQNDLEQLSAFADQLAGTSRAGEFMDEVETKLTRLSALITVQADYHDTAERQATGNRLLAENQADLARAIAEYRSLLPPTCPTCGTPIDPAKVDVLEIVGTPAHLH